MQCCKAGTRCSGFTDLFIPPVSSQDESPLNIHRSAFINPKSSRFPPERSFSPEIRHGSSVHRFIPGGSARTRRTRAASLRCSIPSIVASASDIRCDGLPVDLHMNACICVVSRILRHPVVVVCLFFFAPGRGMRARHHGAHPQRPRLGHVQRGFAHPVSHQLRVHKEGRHLHGPQIPERRWRRSEDVHVPHGLQVRE